MFPLIQINLNKLEQNTRTLVDFCKTKGIETIFGVTKVLAGDIDAMNALITGGITHIADSRIENLRLVAHNPLPKVLLRLPMWTECKEVVQYADMSLNSELETIKRLNEEALKQDRVHGVILMFDLGDLREGIWYQDSYLEVVSAIMKLPNIALKGIGTNLTCYGGVIPTTENLNLLLSIKNEIENRFDFKLEIISGGNTSSLHLLVDDTLPKGINNLRLGEGFVLGRETAYEKDMDMLYQDVFVLKAQIIELKEKPSIPIGKIGVDAFGNKPSFTDKGTIRRAIVGIGKQDIYPGNFEIIDENIELLGLSSDHLLLDVSHTNYQLGDIISFRVTYGGLLQVMTSHYVKKSYNWD